MVVCELVCGRAAVLAPPSLSHSELEAPQGEEGNENFGGSRAQAGGQASWMPHPGLHRLGILRK